MRGANYLIFFAVVLSIYNLSQIVYLEAQLKPTKLKQTPVMTLEEQIFGQPVKKAPTRFRNQ